MVLTVFVGAVEGILSSAPELNIELLPSQPENLIFNTPRVCTINTTYTQCSGSISLAELIVSWDPVGPMGPRQTDDGTGGGRTGGAPEH